MMKKSALKFALALLCSLPAFATPYIEVEIIDRVESAGTRFALTELRNTLMGNTPKSGKIQAGFTMVIEMDSLLGEQSYQIQKSNDTLRLISGDYSGAMYSILDLAEQIKLNRDFTQIREKNQHPYLLRRGIKMNIPLDARTPSYDDTGDAAQQNIAVMWDWDFWQNYLDQLAIDRYNVLTLWNPHPFPSMIKLEEYPDVALNDVCITTLKPVGIENEWAEPQLVSTQVMENLVVVKSITIDEKIAFWQKVMQYAHDRGIDIYFFTWNVCPNSVAKPVSPYYRTYNQPIWEEEPGKYGITNQMDNPMNIPYYQAAIKKFLETYPLVKGIGVTAGEHMIDSAGIYTREQWIWEAYGEPIIEFLEQHPGRKVDFIHRVWNSNMDKIMHYWNNYPGNFEASFKYAKARLYSSPTLPFAEKHIESMKKYQLKSWWNLRNDDIFVLRWGDPDYVRDFITHFDLESTAGFYMGSDGYVWGRVFNAKNPKFNGQLEMEKHWYNFMLWGRLAYDTQLDSSFFAEKLQTRYPGTEAEKLYTAWKTASRIIPKVNCYHWNDWDFQWSVEACIDAREGFHDVIRFMENPTLEKSGMLSPKEYTQQIASGSTQGITPFQVAAALRCDAGNTLNTVTLLRKKTNQPELCTLLDDLDATANLGNYYAAKIEAATELALFLETHDPEYQQKSVELLTEAAGHWKAYARILDKNYQPQMLARTKLFDPNQIMKEVEADIPLAKNVKLPVNH